MIEGYYQYNYKSAILNFLEAKGGKAYAHEVIDALMNGPDQFRIELTSYALYTTELVDQFTADNIEKVKPNKRGIWTRTQKPYIPTDY